MPPKVATTRSASKGEKVSKKSKKAAAQQLAMENATVQAQKLYKQHEQQRESAEQSDKVHRDRALLDVAVEKDRLRADRAEFVNMQKELFEEERLAYREHAKHEGWARVPDASRLPDVSSEREVNTFLSVWRDAEGDFDDFHAESFVIASGPVNGMPPMTTTMPAHDLRFLLGEQGMSEKKRRHLVDTELDMCMQAHELTRAIQLARDRCVARAATTVMTDNKSADREIAFHDENLRNVNRQILAAMDFATVNAVIYYDIVLDGTDADKETLSRMVPEGQPTFKYGLWIKVKEVTRSFTSLLFPEIEVRLDPKSSTLPKLPKALGLSRENVAVRALQLSFDPFIGHDLRGKEYYALDCTIKVDLLSFSHRPREFGEWQLRSGTADAHRLQCQEYPPHSAEARVEDPSFRISFDVPQTIVVRQPSLLIGKWMPATAEWEPCSHIVFGASLSGAGAARSESSARRATFTTGELVHFAILQEKVFDTPYEHWSIRPVSYDQVLITLEGRHRGDTSDRVFRILVENTQCKLLSPDDSELQALRNSWMEPATLFRQLSQAGFNFVLHDEEAKYLSNVLPKSAALEAKAYADIAQYCQFHSVASTRHNKFGEDADMALFHLSKRARGVDEEYNPYDNTELCSDQWYHVRYQLASCVLSAFTEEQDFADLNVLQGYESHYSLYSMLLPIVGEDAVRTQLVNTNYLLRRCVMQILHLFRPLSWG